MYFELSISIKRPPADGFALLRDKDQAAHEEGSPVLLLEKTTPGPPGLGTHYRELVQMLPFLTGEILSEITRFEPNRHPEEKFRGAGMHGHLAYQLLPVTNGTQLIQRELIHYRRVLKYCEPILQVFFSRRLRERLENIKAVLESG